MRETTLGDLLNEEIGYAALIGLALGQLLIPVISAGAITWLTARTIRRLTR